MPPIVYDLFGFSGFLLRTLGFLVAGLAFGRLVLDHLKTSIWQVQIALVLGLFGALIGLTALSSAGSAGAFALGAGGAYFWSAFPAKSQSETEQTR